MSLNYRWALEELRQQVRQMNWYSQFNVLAVALQENLDKEMLFGTTEQLRHERYQLIYRLDQLTISNGLKITFSDLCQNSKQQVEKESETFSHKKQEIGRPQQVKQRFGTGNRWAVLVGINEYIDKRCYGQLQVCAQDATILSKELSNSGYNAEHIRLLTDQNTPQQPSRGQILTALHFVADATEPDDLLLFYFSGHGLVEEDESYLIPRDGTGALRHTGIPVSLIREIMISAQAQAKVIILDACHSGATIQAKGKPFMSEEFITSIFRNAEGLAIISSCQKGQLSYEWPEKGSSVFTYYLLEALRGKADHEEKGFVTVQDVNRYITHQVKEWATRQQLSQSPRLHYVVTGDIMLAEYMQISKDNNLEEEQKEINIADTLNLYIGNLEALHQGNLHQVLTEQLVQEGEIYVRKKFPASKEDILERYRLVPLHAVLLYTTEDQAITAYLAKYWGELDSLTENACDIYPIVDQFKHPGDASAYTFIRELDVLQAAHFDAYEQLPVLFFWDQHGMSEYISFGDDPNIARIRRILRLVFGELHRKPTIATVTEVKKRLQPVEDHIPSTQLPKQGETSVVEIDNMHAQRAMLYQILQTYTNDLDLQEICLDVGILYNRLRGNSHAERAFSLTTDLYNQARLTDLDRVLRKRLPNRFQ